MKKWLSPIIATLLITSVPLQISAEKSNEAPLVKINGQEITFTQEPIIYNDVTLVPMRAVFEELGADVKWDNDTRKITVNKNNIVVDLKIGSKDAFKNNTPFQLMQEPMIINDYTMVPLRFISEALGAEVQWNESSRTISIQSNNNEINNISNEIKETSERISQVSNSQNEDVLTFDEAVDLLSKNSAQIRNALKDIEYSEEIRNEAESNIDYIPFVYSGNDANSMAYKILYSFQQADLSHQMSKRQYQVVVDRLVYSLKEAYNDVLNIQRKIESAKMDLENAKWKNRIIYTKRQNGVSSDFEQLISEATLEELSSTISSLEQNLDDTYQRLNKLIGKNYDERYPLENNLYFEELKNVDLDNHESRVMSSSASVWLAERKINLSELERKIFNPNDPNTLETSEAKEINVQKAKLESDDYKIQLKSAIRSMYYSIKVLEDQYAVLNANLKKAEANLKLVKVKYETGLATAAEVFEVQTQIENIEAQMFDVLVKIDNLKVSFEKPWVLAN